MSDKQKKQDPAAETSTPGGRIKAARALRGLRQVDLAQAAAGEGVKSLSVTHLCSIERGQRDIGTVKVDTLVRLADVLELSLDYVVKGK